MNTFNLKAAANFLGLHPSTLQARAKAGQIPGAKIGKEWRFLDVDLADYLRSQYPANKSTEANRTTVAAAGKRAKAFRSTAASLLEYESALGLPLTQQRRRDADAELEASPRAG